MLFLLTIWIISNTACLSLSQSLNAAQSVLIEYPSEAYYNESREIANLETVVIDKEFINRNNIRVVKFQNCKIKTIQKYIFLHFPLEVIVIRENNIKRVEPYTFVELFYLKEINLNNNNIELIDEYAFLRLVALEGLYLKNNKIKHFGDNYVVLTTLTNLYLSNNNLQYFDSLNFNIDRSITNLFLDNNSITEVNFTTDQNEFIIYHLQLSYNKISELNDDLFNNVLYTVLNLSYNNLRRLPKSCFNKNYWGQIILNENPIEDLPYYKNFAYISNKMLEYNSCFKLQPTLFVLWAFLSRLIFF